MDDLVVGLDIGSSRIRCVAAQWEEEGRPTVVAVGESPSDGIRNGAMVNIKAAVASVAAAVEGVETKGYEVSRVVAGISGPGIEGLNSRGVVAVGSGREITDADMERVMEAARAVVLPLDREILHVIPQEYIVDEVRDIRNPLGMIGVRLEAEAHVMTVGMVAVRNLVHGLNGAGLVVDEILLESLASSEAVLTEEERNYACLLIDMGESTSDVLLWSKGAPRFSRIYPWGGGHVTRDLSQVLGVSEMEAERIKRNEGSCVPGLFPDDVVLVQPVGSHNVLQIPRSDIVRIIEARAEEILETIRRDLLKTHLLEKTGGGVVLTGGGAKLVGMPELAARVFGRLARVGVPMGLGGLKDSYASSEWGAACGLVLAAARGRRSGVVQTKRSKRGSALWHWVEKVFKKII